jgi:hypothetical protein
MTFNKEKEAANTGKAAGSTICEHHYLAGQDCVPDV